MEYGNRLIQVKGKKIKYLLDAVTRLRPDHNNPSINWNSLDSTELKAKLASYIAMRGFSQEELRQLEKEVFKLRINKTQIILAVTVMLLLATTWMYLKYLKFQKLQVVYALGNEVALFDGPDPTSSKIVKTMDIFGRSLSDSNHPRTAHSMIVVADSGSLYIVRDINFLGWLFGKKRTYFVHKEHVGTMAEYEEATKLFDELNGSPHLLSLDINHRKAIQACIESDKEKFFNAKVSNSFTRVQLDSFKPIVTARGPAENYIFLALKLKDGKFLNLRIIIKNNAYAGFEEIKFLTGPFAGPLMWKDHKLDPQQANAIILFREKPGGPRYQNTAPPYNNYNNEKL